MAAKYKKVFDEMMEYNSDLFQSFRPVHDRFQADPEKSRDEFNLEGEKVLRVIRRFENQLCGKSESGMYSKYSQNLSEKFWEEIRKEFPKIDHVGMS